MFYFLGTSRSKELCNAIKENNEDNDTLISNIANISVYSDYTFH